MPGVVARPELQHNMSRIAIYLVVALGAETDMAGRVHSGEGRLHSGAGRLHSGSGRLHGGAGRLHGGADASTYHVDDCCLTTV